MIKLSSLQNAVPVCIKEASFEYELDFRGINSDVSVYDDAVMAEMDINLIPHLIFIKMDMNIHVTLRLREKILLEGNP